MTATALYEPTDVDDAYAAWGANCGPCALAAALGKEVHEVRDYFEGFAKRKYVNPTHMQAALTKAGVRFHRMSMASAYERGVAFVQFTGPWTSPGAPIAAAYRRTHWVATAADSKYDVMFYCVNGTNENGGRGQWMPAAYWEANVLPAMAESVGGYGRYFIRTGYAIER